MITARIDEKKKLLIIEIPATLENLQTSPSGKTLRVASSEGNVTIDNCLVQGKPVTVGVNAWIKK